jgi:hypothetical protein
MPTIANTVSSPAAAPSPPANRAESTPPPTLAERHAKSGALLGSLRETLSTLEAECTARGHPNYTDYYWSGSEPTSDDYDSLTSRSPHLNLTHAEAAVQYGPKDGLYPHIPWANSATPDNIDCRMLFYFACGYPTRHMLPTKKERARGLSYHSQFDLDAYLSSPIRRVLDCDDSQWECDYTVAAFKNKVLPEDIWSPTLHEYILNVAEKKIARRQAHKAKQILAKQRMDCLLDMQARILALQARIAEPEPPSPSPPTPPPQAPVSPRTDSPPQKAKITIRKQRLARPKAPPPPPPPPPIPVITIPLSTPAKPKPIRRKCMQRRPAPVATNPLALDPPIRTTSTPTSDSTTALTPTSAKRKHSFDCIGPFTPPPHKKPAF